MVHLAELLRIVLQLFLSCDRKEKVVDTPECTHFAVTLTVPVCGTSKST